MRRELRYFFYGMSLVLFLIFSSGIQTQSVTWNTYGSMYEYTDGYSVVIYQEGKKYFEETETDSLTVWNVTSVGDKIFFRTNFTPYFMGLQHFETEEERNEYLTEHYWYDNDTDSMMLVYSVIESDLLFIDVNDTNLSFEANISDFDIRLLHEEIYGLFLPVNHSLFNFKTEYSTRLNTEQKINDVVFKQEDTFVLGKMKYEGYYMSLEYIYYTVYLDGIARYEYKIEAMYSLKGELYHYIISNFMRYNSTNENIQYSEKSLTLDSLYRENGLRRISFASPIIIIVSLLLVSYATIRRKRR